MRIASFNLESLDLPPKARVPLEARAEMLRPQLERLDADVLCLQEVNAQKIPGTGTRQLVALDALLAGTRYASYQRAVSTSGEAGGATDVHNLVTLSRLPIVEQRSLLHCYVKPPLHERVTARPPDAQPTPIRLDRPLLLTEIALADGRRLAVINVHLRAPLATAIPGQKEAPFVWKSVAGWAEGYYTASVKRALQALELRLAVDALLDEAPQRLVLVAGDLNAEDHETPLRLVIGAEEDTGNGRLAARALVLLDRAIPEDRRFSIVHYGRPQMFDHMLASRALLAHVQGIEVHNETLGDEALAYAKVAVAPGSYHAPLVLTLNLDGAGAGGGPTA